MATHSRVLALRIPWTEEPGRLQSMELQRVGHDWVTNYVYMYIYCLLIILERKWQLGEQGREEAARVLQLPFLPPSILIFCRASNRAMLGQSIRRFTTSVVRRRHYEEGPGKNMPFSVENKWRLLAMMTLFFGSGFAAPFFIVRHQLLKSNPWDR